MIENTLLDEVLSLSYYLNEQLHLDMLLKLPIYLYYIHTNIEALTFFSSTFESSQNLMQASTFIFEPI